MMAARLHDAEAGRNVLITVHAEWWQSSQPSELRIVADAAFKELEP